MHSLSHLLQKGANKWIPIPLEVQFDLQTWQDFLNHFNGQSMFVKSGCEGPHVVDLATDSSGSWGWGAILNNEYCMAPWPKSVNRSNMALLEFYPIVVSTFLWQNHMQNNRIRIKCDNLATVYIINSLKSRCDYIMILVCIFALQCLKNNIWFQVQHLSGKLNTPGSRCSQLRAAVTAPWTVPGDAAKQQVHTPTSEARKLADTVVHLA